MCNMCTALHWYRCVGNQSCHRLVYAGENAFEGYVPSVPEGEKLDFGSREFREFEDIGKCGTPLAV